MKAFENQTDVPIASADNPMPNEPPQTSAPPIISIVVVEDERNNRQMLVSLLRLSGYRVESAADGEEGLSLIERLQPDAAIIDVGLPGRDGYEVARALRQRIVDRHITLVALTGYGQPEDIAKSLAAGFDHHLVKPLHPHELERVLGPPPKP